MGTRGLIENGDKMANQEFFVKVPHNLVKAPISDRAVRLFAVLGIYRNNETGLAWPGLETLADVMGCSVSSVRRAREELETIGAIDSKQRWNATTVYNVNVSSPLNKVTITDDEGGVTGENKSVTGENKSVTGENKSVTGEQLTRTIKLEPIELEPINLKDDPRDSGLTLLQTFCSELIELIRSGEAPTYETHAGYGDPLERLTLALQLDPDGMEKQLKKKTKTANHLGPFIKEILMNNPHTLMPEDLYFEDLNSLESMAEATGVEFVTIGPSKAHTRPKTSPAGTSAPATVKAAQRTAPVESVLAPNRAWLGNRPTEYQRRCAQVADELGLTIPAGLDPASVGQVLKQVQDLKQVGEQPETVTSDHWRGVAKVSGLVVISD